jgi:hypothetical protein
MKQLIRLTENDLHKMVYAATKQIIKEIEEITTTQAAVAGGSNAAAFRDYTTTCSPNSEAKMNRADLIRLPLITQAIIDKFGNFKIKLVEYNRDNRMSYVNYFVFDCVVLIDDNSCVMKGEISIGGRPYSIGYIRYIFSENKWQRVRCGAALRVTEISQLEPFDANLPLVNSIIDFLKDFLEKEEKNRATAMTGPLIPSKPRKPLSTKAKGSLYGDYLSAYKKNKPTTPTERL